MVRALSILGLVLLSIGSGVAAVSIPIEGKTLAEHVRSRYEAPARPPRAPSKAGRPAEPKVATAKPAAGKPATKPVVKEGTPTRKDRDALDSLIGEKLGG